MLSNNRSGAHRFFPLTTIFNRVGMLALIPLYVSDYQLFRFRSLDAFPSQLWTRCRLRGMKTELRPQDLLERYFEGTYSQENMYPMSYYGALFSGNGGQQHAQVPAYYAAAWPGVYQNINPAIHNFYKATKHKAV